MPDAKTTEKTAESKVAPKAEPAKSGLTPAGESSNPAVHQLLAELQTHQANGDVDDAQDIVAYLAELGYSAG